MTTAFDFMRKNLRGVAKAAGRDQPKKPGRSQSDRQMTTRLAGENRVTPVYGARNAFRRPLGANVCDRVGGGVPGSRDPLSSSCGHENHADVCVFAWMAGKCVS